MNATISNLQEQSAVASQVRWDRFECAILESPSRTCLLRAAEAQALGLENYRCGLLFGSQAELRFRQRRNGRFHLVYIDDDGGHLDGAEPVGLRDEAGPERIFLWGESFGGGFWYESRIPQELRYPAAPGWRVAVRIRHYRLETRDRRRPNLPADLVHLFRCCGLEPVQKPQTGKEADAGLR